MPYLAYKNLPKSAKKNIIPFESPTPARSVGLVTHQFFVKKALKKALFSIIQKSVSKLIKETNETAVIIKPL